MTIMQNKKKTFKAEINSERNTANVTYPSISLDYIIQIPTQVLDCKSKALKTTATQESTLL